MAVHGLRGLAALGEDAELLGLTEVSAEELAAELAEIEATDQFGTEDGTGARAGAGVESGV